MVAATATGSVALLGVAAGVGYAAAGSSAGASSDAATTTTTTPSATAPTDADRAKQQTDRLNKVLQPLVDKGTITASQRDAIVAALVAAEPKGGRGGHGPGGGGPGGMMRGVMGLFGADADAAAKAIGISTDDLKKAVLGGQSVATVAKAHNVDPQKVIDALVAATKAQLAAHPKADGATDAQITEQITALVNGTLPKMGGGFGHGGRGGRGDWGGPDAPGTPPAGSGAPDAPTTTAPTTTSPESTTTAPSTTVPETTTTTS